MFHPYKIIYSLILGLLLGFTNPAQSMEAKPNHAPSKNHVLEQINQLEEKLQKLKETVTADKKTDSGLIQDLQQQKPISLFIDSIVGILWEGMQLALASVRFIENLPTAIEWLAVEVWQHISYLPLGTFLVKLSICLLICLGIFMLVNVLIKAVAQRLKRYQALLWRSITYTILYMFLPHLSISALKLLQVTRLEQQVGFLISIAASVALLLLHLSQIFLDPYNTQGRRLIPLPDVYCQRLHRFIKWFGLVGIGGTYMVLILLKVGMPLALATTVRDAIAFTTLLVTAYTIIQLRHLYTPVLVNQVSTAPIVRRFMYQLWHLPLLVLVVVIYLDFCEILPNTQGFIVNLILMLVVATFLSVIEDKLVMVRTYILPNILGSYSKQLLPTLEGYASTIDRVITWGAYGSSVILILEIWGVPIVQWLTSGTMQIVLHKSMVIAFIVLMVLLILRLSNFLFTRYSAHTKRRDGSSNARVTTVVSILRNSLRVGLWVPATFLVLSELGFDITPLVASFSLLSLAVSFGAQNLIRDIITGLFIILEDTVSVGDYVTLDGLTGHVETLTIRTIALRAEDGTLHTIPFSSITKVSNQTRQYAVVVTNIAVNYHQNLDHVLQAMRQAYDLMKADPKMGKLLLADLEIKGVDDFQDTGVIIKALLKTVVLKHNDVKRGYNRYLKEVFDREGIPFANSEPSQHLVYMGNIVPQA